eukprot:CAMPEP_0197320888 /NCGR_PEP_ID=MMETSP0891-20130614/62165_1 /TAXON_ID=44058 ORGANISM="Aureoumbra lagunensis, Strain CCMP1510" /NCGR_SAMPLE_ID=MMETSP0891 /ASSEMBLY_ACC=CAM_ASM_000534 /LENGTH=649 /DNA_ID=CAMNT_0042812471 /DNA_START=18 /DNA_END=1964 /DNA_ORIENTATION=+
MVVTKGKMPNEKKKVLRGFRKNMARATGMRHFFGGKAQKEAEIKERSTTKVSEEGKAKQPIKKSTEKKEFAVIKNEAQSAAAKIKEEKSAIAEKEEIVPKEEKVVDVSPPTKSKIVAEEKSVPKKEDIPPHPVQPKVDVTAVPPPDRVAEKELPKDEDDTKKILSFRRLPDVKKEADPQVLAKTAAHINEVMSPENIKQSRGRSPQGGSMLDMLAKQSSEKLMNQVSPTKKSKKKKMNKQESNDSVASSIVPEDKEIIINREDMKSPIVVSGEKSKEGVFVIDAGGWKTRVGFAGEEIPRLELETIVGRRKSTMGGDSMPEYAYGNSARRASTVYDLNIPISRGFVTHWDEAEKLWTAAFMQVCQDSKPKACLIASGVLQPKATKQKLAELCLDRLGFDAFHIGVSPVLALFGAGYTTGLVLDCGKDASRAVPVYDGFALPHAIIIDPCLGGDALDAATARILETKSLGFKNNDTALIAGQACKQQVGFVAPPGISVDQITADHIPTQKALIPARTLSKSCRELKSDAIDATSGDIIIMLDPRECATIGETLFKPQINNSAVESPGLAGIIFKAISATDIDLRKSFYEGVLLVGAGSLLPNTPERLDHELQHLAPQNAPVAITAYDQRDLAAFHGAAMVSSLDDFSNNW